MQRRCIQRHAELSRLAWRLATLNREQLLDADREDDLDELVTEAREVMQETMTEGPA